ncbi:MAG: lysostaphin resistance A-like protein [Alphaproteobacteria bacterium]
MTNISNTLNNILGVSINITKMILSIVLYLLISIGLLYVFANYIQSYGYEAFPNIKKIILNEGNHFGLHNRPEIDDSNTIDTSIMMIIFPIAWWIWAKLTKFKWEPVVEKPPYKIMLLGVVAPFIIMLVGVFIEIVFENNRTIYLAENLYRAFNIGASAAALEEVLDRGLLIGIPYYFFILKYNKQHLTIPLVVLGGFIFGIMHMTNHSTIDSNMLLASLQSVMAFVGGVSYGLLYIVTGKLRYSIAVHFVYNFLCSFYIFNNEWTPPMQDFSILETALTNSLILICDALMGYFLYKIWKENRKKPAR